MLVLIIVTAFVIGVIHWYIKGSHNFWKKKGVPFPTPTYLIGNIGDAIIMKKHLGTVYEEIYKDFRDCSYVGFYKLLKPGLLLRDMDLIKDVLIKDFPSFHDNDIEIDEETDPLFGKNPFVLKGNRWKVIRGRVTSAMTVSKIKHMFTFINHISKELVEYLNNNCETKIGNGLDAKDLSIKFTTDVVASCAFGLEGNSFTDPNAEFKIMGEKLFRPDFWDSLKRTVAFLILSFAKILKLSFISAEVQNWFIRTLRQTIKYREKNNIVRNDYLDLMISFKSKAGDYVFNNMDVMAQAMTFFSDGTETSAITLNFTLYEIAKNPDIQINLRKEITSVLAKYNGEIVYDALQEMVYLDMVISEALRMYPPEMNLLKVCTKKYTLPSPKREETGFKVVINPGMSIIIPVYAIHYDPQFYTDPEKFNPERFTEEAKKNRPKCAYLPFGEGPRKCLGFRFAMVQIKAALAAIISNFEIKVNAKTSPQLEIDPLSLLLAKKDGIWLNFNKLDN